MNCASSERVTSILEEPFFTWNNLVLTAKSSEECTPNHFWQIFRVFLGILVQAKPSYDQPFCQNWFKRTVRPLKEWPISWRKFSLLETIEYWLQKVPKSAPRIIFVKVFSFLRNFSISETFTSYDQLLLLLISIEKTPFWKSIFWQFTICKDLRLWIHRSITVKKYTG